MYRLVEVLFAGLENGVGPFWAIGRVREVLGFQAETAVLGIVSADGCAIQEVSRVELNARFSRVDFHLPASLWVANGRRRTKSPRLAINHVAMVVADRRSARIVQSLANCGEVGEVEWRPADGSHFPGWNGSRINWEVTAGIEFEFVVADGARSSEVPVVVIGQVERSRFVGGSPEFNDELVFIGQSVGDFGTDVARVTFLPILALVLESDADRPGCFERFGLPHHLVKALGSAVKVVGGVVGGEGVFLAVQRELAFGDPVAVTANRAVEIHRAGFETCDIGARQQDVAVLSLSIGDL